MSPIQTYITPFKFSMLAIRTVALFLFFSSLSYVSYLLVDLVERTPLSEATVGPYAAVILIYAIVLWVLIRHPEPIARVLSGGVPRFTTRSRWTKAELLATIIAAVAVYEILSGIPSLFSQIYGIFGRYSDMLGYGAPEKARFNLLVVGLFGSILKIVAASIVFLRSDELAAFWDRQQGGTALKRSHRFGR